MAVQYAPHSAVFPRACVVVHQGGIGTTGEAMRAGHPTLVVHYGHDQPDNAARLVRMGMARSMPRERYNANVAVREIQHLLENITYAERAAAIGAQVRSENGTARACDLLGRLLEDPNAEVTNPQLCEPSRGLTCNRSPSTLETSLRTNAAVCDPWSTLRATETQHLLEGLQP
jgi:hypothetical protein